MTRTGLTLVALMLAALPANAQQRPLAARLAGVGTGTAEFRFPARSGACGDGRTFIRVGRNSTFGSFSDDMDTRPCVPGPVRVVVTLASGAATRVKAYVGPEPADNVGMVDLGTVTAAEGSSYLLDIAARTDVVRASRDAIFPALLGEGVVAWPRLLQIARGETVTEHRRHSEATFWLGRYAAAKLDRSDDPFAGDDQDESDEQDVKGHAVFALSQLRGREGVEPLIQIARTNKDPYVRSKALFWLGESRDPRAIDVFEEILKRGR